MRKDEAIKDMYDLWVKDLPEDVQLGHRDVFAAGVNMQDDRAYEFRILLKALMDQVQALKLSPEDQRNSLVMIERMDEFIKLYDADALIQE